MPQTVPPAARHAALTQKYSTWGDKLLQHADVLHAIQAGRTFRPITVQVAPTEACDSDCPFCSVAGRPLKSAMPWPALERCLRDFRGLGAKAVEVTGGGNPLLYRCKETGKTVNDVVRLAAGLGLDVGVITNAHDFGRLDPAVYDLLTWVRVSLIKLDEGKEPEDYDFKGFPESRLGFSYIVHDTGGKVDLLSRTGRAYPGTTPDTFARIARLVARHPGVKFVRIAGDCLKKGGNARVRERWEAAIEQADPAGRFFVKDIGGDDSPFDGGCYVGLTRPYVAPHPAGDGTYHVYACTSHVLANRTYDPAYALCRVEDVVPAWAAMNERFRRDGFPYEVRGNGGAGWAATCRLCYYANNNRLLHAVAHPLPDRNFA